MMRLGGKRDLAGVQFLRTVVGDFEFAAFVESVPEPSKLY
jgi:hypothetical protein